jgi:3-phytase
MTTRWLMASGRCCVAWAVMAGTAPAAPADKPTAQSAPALLGRAESAAPLRGGGWLLQDKRALRLVDANGRETARLDMRAEHLDLREDHPNARSGPARAAAVAMVVEAASQQTLRLRIDEAAGTLTAEPVLASPPFSVEAACLYRDAQGLDHVFLISDEGLVEQWLLREAAPALKVRQSAVAPQPTGCRADDRAGLLYVNTEDSGLWAYRADAEGPPARWPVLLTQPHGALAKGSGAFVAWPGGVASVGAANGVLHLLTRGEVGEWRATRTQQLQVKSPVESMAVRVTPGAVELFWREEDAKSWQRRRVPWTHPADAGLAAPLPLVLPAAATAPVNRFGDAADDPAIWVHPSQPSRSRVLGTNKRAGLHVYDLEGRELQFLASGRVNNVDVRQNVRLGNQTLDLAVASQRDDLSLVVYQIDNEGTVQELGRVPTQLKGIYGLCLYRPSPGGLQVIVNDQDGTVERWALALSDGRIEGQRVQRFALRSQPEGCVVDDSQARLFIGEEDRAVWAVSLASDAAHTASPKLERVIGVGGNPELQADIEGLALYDGAAGSGRYLVVSSQGNHSYFVLDAHPPYRIRGAFRIGADTTLGIDGVSETDGLDVTAQPLGERFPKGVLVVQDGFKRMPDGPQNFKIIDWREVVRALNLP